MQRIINLSATIVVGVAIILSLLWSATGIARAASSIDVIELFRPLSILGIGVQAGQTAKLILVDTSATSTAQSYTLPTTAGNNGEWYIIKSHGSVGSAPPVHIYTAAGDTFENESFTHYQHVGEDGAFVSFIADEDNGTWWTIGTGYPIPNYD